MANTIQVFLFVSRMLFPFWRSILLMFIVGIIWAIDFSLRPYIFKIILNKIAENSTDTVFDHIIGPISAYLLVLLLFLTMLRIHSYFIDIKMIPQLRKKIAESVFSILLQHSHYYYQNTFSGNIVNKVNDLTSNIPDITQIIIDRFFSHSLCLIIATYTLWQVSVNFAFLMLSWVGIIIIVSCFYSKKIVCLANAWSEYSSEINGRVTDVLSNILLVKLFSLQKQEKLLLNNVLQQSVLAEQKLGWGYFWIFLIYGYSYIIVLGINVFFLVKGIQEEIISLGDFALVLSINLSISDFLWQLVRDFSQYSKHLGKLKQAIHIISLPLEIQDKIVAKDLVVTRGEIIFNSVQFYYKNTYKLFNNKSIDIKAGQKVGLVGYSGSGKSTFVNLILRLFDVISGEILIDKQNIQYVTQDSLRKNIAVVPQDSILFHRTVMDNIRIGRIEATEQEVIEAAIAANAHSFILNLPLGYNSFVGERGVKLSGGQRQRIAFARAILKNAPIWILDEATSQLDSVTENYIQGSLWKLIEGKTTIVIAHRLTTLLHMDRILVFDKGQIIQDGTHEELQNIDGLYKKLWGAQLSDFVFNK